MTEDQVRQLAEQALRETPGKAAEITLVIEKDKTWVVLLNSRGEELAIKAEGSTPQAIKEQLVEQVRSLF